MMKAPNVKRVCVQNLTEKNHDQPSYLADTFLIGMKLYKHVLHSGISSGCPSYPSCSQYMVQAITRYGAPVGIVLGLERLLHETGELHHGKYISTSQGVRVYDPLENNTSWWDSPAHE
ncbi:membrane protein insertion efficiency factor YidD [bacterium]|nr:membrane protein insertion efficiency factor YidD [bacterium]